MAAFLAPDAAGFKQKSLADIIMAKIREKQEAQGLAAVPRWAPAGAAGAAAAGSGSGAGGGGAERARASQRLQLAAGRAQLPARRPRPAGRPAGRCSRGAACLAPRPAPLRPGEEYEEPVPDGLDDKVLEVYKGVGKLLK
jgi:hypothetical protein